MKLKDNPLFKRLAPLDAFPSLLLTLLGAAGVFLLCGLLLVGATFLPEISVSTIGLLLSLSNIVVQLLRFAIVAWAAAITAAMVTRDREGGSSEIMQLTPLEPRRVLVGYGAAGIYRARVGIAVLLGLIPLGLAQTVVVTSQTPGLGSDVLFGVASVIVLSPLYLLSLLLLAVSVGTLFGILSKTMSSAIVGTLGTLFLFGFIGLGLSFFTGLAVTVLGGSALTGFSTTFYWVVFTAQSLFAGLVLPLVAAWAAFAIAARRLNAAAI